MLLSERSKDPEEILTNLGFVDQSEDTETDNIQRLPERFLEQPSSAKGIDVGALDVNRLLNLSEHEEMLEQINTSKMNAEFADQGKFYYNSTVYFVESVPKHYINMERFKQLYMEFCREDTLVMNQEYNFQNANKVFSSSHYEDKILLQQDIDFGLKQIYGSESVFHKDVDKEVEQISANQEMFMNVFIEETADENMSPCSTTTSQCSDIFHIKLASNESLV
jgi:hypothetical protein